jgi:hypothetical protein
MEEMEDSLEEVMMDEDGSDEMRVRSVKVGVTWAGLKGMASKWRRCVESVCRCEWLRDVAGQGP